MGVGVAHFPNFMMFLGPYSPVANGPTLASIGTYSRFPSTLPALLTHIAEAQAEYILHAIDRYQTEPIHSFHPTPAAESDFTAHVADFMQRSVYTDKCRSGHKGHTVAGRTPTLWPGSTLHYLQAMREFRGSDWDVRYTGNRFAYLGNGVSHAEFDPTSDLGYYLKEEDEGEPLTRREVMREVFRSGSQPERMLHFTYRPDVINLLERRRKKKVEEEGAKTEAEEEVVKIEAAAAEEVVESSVAEEVVKPAVGRATAWARLTSKIRLLVRRGAEGMGSSTKKARKGLC